MAKLLLQFNTLRGCPLREKEIRTLFLKTFRKTGRSLHWRQVAVSLALVSPREIRRLNRIYRKKDKVTDILSFSNYASLRALFREKGESIDLGELVVCFPFVAESAKMNQVPFRRESAFVLVHGLLHLLGMEHGKKMFSLQDCLVVGIK